MAEFVNTIDNDEIYAKRAECDEDGSNIKSTYATKSEIPSVPVQDVEVNGTSVLNAQGIAEVVVPTQVQADWSQSDNTALDYIKNKPGNATQSTDGFMSSTDKTKLDGIQSGAEVNVQADWNQSNSSSDDYIKNKPGNATQSTAGFMSSTDKTKLDGIQSGAEVNVQANWTQTNTSSDDYIKNKPGNATQSTDGFMSSTDKAKLDGIAAGAEVNVQANWNETDNTADSYIQNKPGNATQSTDGFMSSTDKTKLDGIESGAEVNVQADWDQTSSSSDDFIKNKPATKAMVGGAGIAISETSSLITISSTVGLPPSTSADAGKALTVDNNGDPEWSDGPTLTAGSNITLTNANNALTIAATVPVTDVTVDGTSVVSNGTAAISMPTELVPIVTSGDDGKVLKATYSGGAGSYAWATEGGTQVQADWDESDPSAADYIKNKPADAPSDGKEYVRKNGAWTESSGAVETVLFDGGSNGDISIKTTNLVLSEATTNFDKVVIMYRSNDGYVGSVEFDPATTTRVQMVTFTPLGNGFTYVKAATITTVDYITWTKVNGPTEWKYKSSDGTGQAWNPETGTVFIHKVIGIKNGVNLYNIDRSETVLYNTATSTEGTIVLSESPSHFKKIAIYIEDTSGYGGSVTENVMETSHAQSLQFMNASYMFVTSTNKLYSRGCSLEATSSSDTSWILRFWARAWTTDAVNSANKSTVLTRIVGINRITSA